MIVKSPIQFFQGTSSDWGRFSSMSNKMKTHKGVKKRFRLSAKGKPMHRSAGTSHRNVRVSAKRKRNLRGTTALEETMVKTIQRSLGKYSY